MRTTKLCPRIITPDHVNFVDLKHKGKIIEVKRYKTGEELNQIIREHINNIKCGKVININPKPVRENSHETAPIQIDNLVDNEASSLFDNDDAQFSPFIISFEDVQGPSPNTYFEYFEEFF